MKSQPLIISIHMPKTAGVSFRATLEEHFGEGFSHDYADFPLNQPPQTRYESAIKAGEAVNRSDFSSISCIHGHFLPVKYLELANGRDCKFVTWLREPLARLVSHYHYWYRTYDESSLSTAALHRRVVEESWSLEDFCLSKELRNVYTQFLSGFPMDKLDFIGITEHYEQDLRHFSEHYLCEKVTAKMLNRRSDSAVKVPEEQLSTDFWETVSVFHSEDIALYNMALARRSERVLVSST